MPKLIFVMGIPKSGKSRYVQQRLEEDHEKWVSRESIRLAVAPDDYFAKESLIEGIFVNRIIEGLKEDYDVYAELATVTRIGRLKLLRRIPKKLYDELEIIWLNVDANNALAFNERVPEKEKIGRAIIHRMAETLQPPQFNEGFDKISIVDVFGETKAYIEGDINYVH